MALDLINIMPLEVLFNVLPSLITGCGRVNFWSRSDVSAT